MNPKKIIIIAVIILLGFFYYGWKYHWSEEAKIRKILYHAANSFENKDYDACAALLPEDFKSQSGANKEKILRELKNFFSRMKEIEINILSTDIQYTDSVYTTNTSCSIRVSGGGMQGSDIQRVTFKLKKVDNAWKIFYFDRAGFFVK